MSLNSCLYEGYVEHRRHLPVEHVFRYGLFMLYVDLEELPTLFKDHWLWSTLRPIISLMISLWLVSLISPLPTISPSRNTVKRSAMR